MITIRKADVSDAALIADLSRSTFADTFAEFNTEENMQIFMDEQFTHAALMKEVTGFGNIFLLAFEDDCPVGYARVRINNNPPALRGKQSIEIARLYAVKESIGKGVGKRLMTACLELGRQLKKDWVWLGVWEKNTRAIDFYKSWGFIKFADHDFILGEDVQNDWLMKKALEH